MALDPITLRPPSPDDAALSELLVRELLARTKASGLALVGAMTLMWLIVRDAVPVWTCALFIAVVVFAALRVVGTLWLERQVPFPVRRAFYWFLALGALIGLTLGVIVLVTFRDLSLARIEMCSIVVVGIDFGAMVSLAASPLVFAAYVSGNIAALMFGAFAYDVEASHVYQAMQIVFSVSVFAMARVVHLSLRAHFELRLEVARHLAELKATQAQLVETSRLAGRADVASAVIHNVGNVLNSVNVSAQLVRDTVVGWRTAGLARVATILEELRAAGTLRTDPRGGTVVAYLTELSAAMERDKRAVGVEVEALQRNIDHIRTIVRSQAVQVVAADVAEVCDIDALLADAVLFTLGPASTEAGVTREVAAVPPLMLDRHKALQIVMNLLTNARDAVAARPAGERRIAVRAAVTDGALAIEVEDNGAGIAPERLEQIFSLGFTTKAHGQGLGLHYSACAARELGGALTVRSDGPGRGAAFRLTLPVVPMRAARTTRSSARPLVAAELARS